ncbi:unnamed protein product [Amoebophrya sp. A120]|nr:unnamed protein product [Amoebophrya sp. A120]|eukprot:GSA120T00000634001.1
MLLCDRRLLSYNREEEQLQLDQRPTILERMCEYQRDIQDLERKMNKCNQILRKPLLPIRDRKLWIDNAIRDKVLNRKSAKPREDIVKELQAPPTGAAAAELEIPLPTRTSQQRKSATIQSRGPATAAREVRLDEEEDVTEELDSSVATTPAVSSRRASKVKPASAGQISVRLFRLKKLNYPEVGECDYSLRVGYPDFPDTWLETTPKPSETGTDCVIQQQLVLEQYSTEDLVCEILANGTVIGRTRARPNEADFKDYPIMAADETVGTIGVLIYAVKKADTSRASQAVGSRTSLRTPVAGGSSSSKGLVLRVDKVAEIPTAALSKKQGALSIRAGYGTDPQTFKLRTQEQKPKVPDGQKTARAIFQQSVQLEEVSDVDNSPKKLLTVALFENDKLISSALLEDLQAYKKAFATVQLKDAKGKKCGYANVRLDDPKTAATPSSTGKTEEEEAEEEAEEE